MRARALTLRALTLLAAAAAAIHQLRYAIGFGNSARHELAVQGHAYLTALLPFVAALGVLMLAAMLRAPLAPAPGRRTSLRRLWLTAFVALVVAYVAQETLEGALASGHPTGLAGVFGAGGWVAVVLAAPAALLVALGLRGDEAVAYTRRARVQAVALASAPYIFSTPAAPPRGHSGLRLLPARGPPLPSAG